MLRRWNYIATKSCKQPEVVNTETWKYISGHCNLLIIWYEFAKLSCKFISLSIISILQSFTKANILLKKYYSLRTNKAAENGGKASVDDV